MAFDGVAMRRADKAVRHRAWMERVLEEAEVLYLGLASPDGAPYVLPLGFGFESGTIYIHGAGKGLKKDLIEANPRVSFHASVGLELMRDEIGSEFSMRYRSVIGFGEAREVLALAEKNHALAAIMKKYDGPHLDLTEEHKGAVWVARIDIREMTGKVSGYPHPEREAAR